MGYLQVLIGCARSRRLRWSLLVALMAQEACAPAREAATTSRSPNRDEPAHKTRPDYSPLQLVPENRVYVSQHRVEAFLRAFLSFAHGVIQSDDGRASGVEIGRPDATYRRVRVESGFGKMVVMVTDGHLPYPYGREVTGYEVADLADTLAKARASGVVVLVDAYAVAEGRAAMVQFPGGYVAEIHARVP
jgi:hypothetical protein